MSQLEKSNQAHASVFMFLTINGQTFRTFIGENGKPGVGEQQLADLTYFNSAATQGMLKNNAALIAHLLIEFINKYYTQQREKDFADKSNFDLAGVFLDVMVKSEKTVFDLATLADSIFNYGNEKSAAVPLVELIGK